MCETIMCNNTNMQAKTYHMYQDSCCVTNYIASTTVTCHAPKLMLRNALPYLRKPIDNDPCCHTLHVYLCESTLL